MERKHIIKVSSEIYLSPCSKKDYDGILAQYVKHIRDNSDRFQAFDIFRRGNIKVGNLHIFSYSPDLLGLEWIDIEKEHRGHKYATQVISKWIQTAKEKGYKEVILEVPGNAPDARHIYEKLGFKMTGEVREKNNPSWNGLYRMSLKL